MRILLSNPRVSEISRLDLTDIIITNHGKGESILLRIKGKGRKLRTLPLDKDTKTALFAYLNTREVYITDKLPSKLALFVGRNTYNKNGKNTIRLGVRGIQHIVNVLTGRANLDKTFHHINLDQLISLTL